VAHLMATATPAPIATLAGQGRALEWRAVAGLAALALVARVIGLDGGLWIDEIYALVRSFRQPFAVIVTEYWGDNHHPFYAVLAHGSLLLFGEHPWTVRLPAMLFGVASVPALYALARELVPRREALLASALLAVSYHHVWFSQNARGYAVLAFCTLLCTWALLRGLAGDALRPWIIYGVSAGLGAYTHLTMVFVVVGHALAALLEVALPDRTTGRRARVSHVLVGFTLSAAIALACYAPMLRGVVDFFVNRPSGLVGVSTPSWALGEAIRQLVAGLGAGVALVGAVAVAAGGAMLLAGFAGLARRRRAFATAAALPVLVTLAGALLARGTMYPRFFFFAIGIGVLVVVHGAFALAQWWLARGGGGTSRAERVATGVVLALVVLSALSLARNYRYPKQDFEGAMRYVLANRAPGDAVVSTGIPNDPYRTLWGQPWPNVRTRAELDAARAGSPRTWVLYTFPRYLERGAPELAALLARDCHAARTFRGTVGGGDIFVCTLEGGAGGA
jgi:mannosyltransferase